jgi:hypothetical protein
MPSFQFYAAATDRESVVAFAFDSLACRVFEAYSAYDAPLRELADVSEFVSLSTAGGVQACHLAVWSPSFGAEPQRRRIELTAGSVPGHIHWFALEGWGLVHLQFAAIKNDALSPSRLAFNSEARARTWESTESTRLGAIAAWDWHAVAYIGRRLRNYIARTAVAKTGARPILPGANERAREGIILAAV